MSNPTQALGLTPLDTSRMSTCESLLRNGDACGVVAVGRCGTCERAFCRSHQAFVEARYGGVETTYRSWCVSCQSDAQGKRAEDEQVALRESARQHASAEKLIPLYIAALVAAGFPGSRSRTETKHVKTWRGWQTHREDLDPAIPVGDATWRHAAGPHGLAAREASEPTGITRSGRYVLMNDVPEPSSATFVHASDVHVAVALRDHCKRYGVKLSDSAKSTDAETLEGPPKFAPLINYKYTNGYESQA